MNALIEKYVSVAPKAKFIINNLTDRKTADDLYAGIEEVSKSFGTFEAFKTEMQICVDLMILKIISKHNPSTAEEIVDHLQKLSGFSLKKIVLIEAVISSLYFMFNNGLILKTGELSPDGQEIISKTETLNF